MAHDFWKKYNEVHIFSWCKRPQNVSRRYTKNRAPKFLILSTLIWDDDSYSSLLGDFMLNVKLWLSVHQQTH